MEANTLKEYCVTAIKNEWLESSSSFPDFLSQITIDTKKQNEAYVTQVTADFQAHFKKFPHIPFGRKKWKHKMQNLTDRFLNNETIIGIHNNMNKNTLDLFQQELKEFLYHVRTFAPELSFEGIGQATRNYIVYAMFKQMHKQDAGFSPACFGYSMLYPFTDNYIDNEVVSDQEKSQYNQMIREKIEGKTVYPASLHGQKTCTLLNSIETAYPRDRHTDIYTLLLLMLEAQEESLHQQRKGVVLTSDERLDISLYKGGISVLIDYFFVNKEITQEDLQFYLGFGYFLQLADDLQDINEDYIKGNQTLFTVDLNDQAEEMLVNKMLHFIHHITNSYTSPDNNFKNMLLSNCYLLIFMSIAESPDYFSQKYIDKLEHFLPVSYSFLKDLKKNKLENKDDKTQEKYMFILDEMIAF